MRLGGKGGEGGKSSAESGHDQQLRIATDLITAFEADQIAQNNTGQYIGREGSQGKIELVVRHSPGNAVTTHTSEAATDKYEQKIQHEIRFNLIASPSRLGRLIVVPLLLFFQIGLV